MNRKLVIDSSETGKTVIEYSKLSVQEIESRIKAYEKKHAMSYARFDRSYDCDYATREDTRDLMDWENLVEEKKERSAKPRGKRELEYQKP